METTRLLDPGACDAPAARTDAAARRGEAAAPAALGGIRPRGERAFASESLFAGASEVVITHRGLQYRLKQTALGKLILTK